MNVLLSRWACLRCNLGGDGPTSDEVAVIHQKSTGHDVLTHGSLAEDDWSDLVASIRARLADAEKRRAARRRD